MGAAVLVPLLAIVGVANAWNLQGWPGRVNDDEGTYVAEAWAILVPHHLSHYTYWYDHPPLGWALIAGWAWLTNGFQRYPSAVMLGREVMWLANLVSCASLYVLARRLYMNRATSAVAVMLFGLSPLAIYFHRMVFLDNLGTMWMLASLSIAASPRRSLSASLWSAVCLGIATLSKETMALCLPALVWLLWQHTHRQTRWWNLSVFGSVYGFIVGGYPLFAALRGELFPGPGHVSLWGGLTWQLLNRQGSGSVLDVHSAAFGLARSWIELDPWLLLGGVALLPLGFMLWQLRPVALALGLQVAILLKGGYVPYMYVTAMLPFAALLIAGAADACGHPMSRIRRPRHAGRTGSAADGYALIKRIALVCATLIAIIVVVPSWWHALYQQAQIHGQASSLAATAWINHRLTRGTIVVVDDYMWPDVTMHGQATPVWCWKVDGDPWVSRHVLPNGYRSVDYVVLSTDASCELDDNLLPTLKAALKHSIVVKRFGDGITVRKVITK